MSPVRSVYHIANSSLSYSKSSRQRHLIKPWMTELIDMAYVTNLIFRQLSCVIIRTSCIPLPMCLPIHHIVKWGTETKMIHVAAWWIIARVADLCSPRNYPVLQHPSQTMNAIEFPLEITFPVPSSPTRPHQTTFFCWHQYAPKPICRVWSGHS